MPVWQLLRNTPLGGNSADPPSSTPLLLCRGPFLQSIESVLNNQAFTHSKLDTWSNNVIEACLKRCTALGKPFKYVVTSHLTQKVGAGMHVASTSLTDPKTDGKLSTTWGNNTMQCVVTLYWLAI